MRQKRPRMLKFDVFLKSNPRQTIKSLFAEPPDSQIVATDLESARTTAAGVHYTPVVVALNREPDWAHGEGLTT